MATAPHTTLLIRPECFSRSRLFGLQYLFAALHAVLQVKRLRVTLSAAAAHDMRPLQASANKIDKIEPYILARTEVRHTRRKSVEAIGRMRPLSSPRFLFEPRAALSALVAP